jgi:hypothetical protein
MVKKPRKGTHWTEESELEFKALARQKIAAPKLARHFGRTEEAIRVKAQRLGISLNSKLARRARK